MKSNLVGYVCRAKVHVDASRNATVAAGSPVTVYAGEWAYCPAGAPFEHEWQGIEPLTLANLKFSEVPRPRESAPEDSRR
jgi:mannose-6-phosphate isomerase-like protein (cupin superfamily)